MKQNRTRLPSTHKTRPQTIAQLFLKAGFEKDNIKKIFQTNGKFTTVGLGMSSQIHLVLSSTPKQQKQRRGICAPRRAS